MTDKHAAREHESGAFAVEKLAGMYDLVRGPDETLDQFAHRFADYLETHWDGTRVEPTETPKGQDVSWLCRYGPRFMCVLSPCKCADSVSDDIG